LNSTGQESGMKIFYRTVYYKNLPDKDPEHKTFTGDFSKISDFAGINHGLFSFFVENKVFFLKKNLIFPYI